MVGVAAGCGVTAAVLVIASFGVVDDSDFIFNFGLFAITLLGVWSLAVTYYMVRKAAGLKPEWAGGSAAPGRE